MPTKHSARSRYRLAPPSCGSLNSAHFHGTHVPVEEPSIASEADIHKITGVKQKDRLAAV